MLPIYKVSHINIYLHVFDFVKYTWVCICHEARSITSIRQERENERERETEKESEREREFNISRIIRL